MIKIRKLSYALVVLLTLVFSQIIPTHALGLTTSSNLISPMVEFCVPEVEYSQSTKTLFNLKGGSEYLTNVTLILI